MNLNRNVLLTFDYELYLGARTGTANRCLLQPTDRLQQILAQHKACGVFFVDTIGIQKMGQIKSLGDDVKAIHDQLKALYKDGHYIFPHLHPHWLDAQFISNINQFDLSNLSKYSIASLKNDQIAELFAHSIQFLKSIGIQHTNFGYRAGGWCIQPFSKFQSAFSNNSIYYDFSVMPGYINNDSSQGFDFSTITRNEPYRFSEEPETEYSKGSFVEFPISTTKLERMEVFTDKLWRKYLWKLGDKGYGDGLSAKTSVLKSVKPNHEMLSIELLTYPKVSNYKNFLKKHTYMHWISHPKMFTKHGLNLFSNFLVFANSNYKVEYNFINMIPPLTT